MTRITVFTDDIYQVLANFFSRRVIGRNQKRQRAANQFVLSNTVR